MTCRTPFHALLGGVLPISSRAFRRGAIALVVIALLVVISASAGCLLLADWWTTLPVGSQAEFVGRDSCMKCHQPQAQSWHGSHHDLAMDHARTDTVLGDFDNAQFEYQGVTSTMFQREGRYFVNTEGPDGEMQDFEVKYVLGVEPLQQYMIEFDRPAEMPSSEIARLQVLRVSWDTEKKRWFYVPPPDVDDKLDPDDPLHWTQAGQNWNHMCASCHSTNLQKNFDVATETYHTTFSEIDVSCEACHGPGSLHVELAENRWLFWDRKLGYGLKKLKGDDSTSEIETCAKCHSRRHSVYPEQPGGQEYYDCFANELLTPTTYYADGQILDEVYVFGSFLQSKMYHKGVRCSDCHDPHSTQLKYEGNAMCTSCHEAHSAQKYDTPAHHRHDANSAGAQCVSCHMPDSPFMEVDFRRDHSIRVPRPDISVDLGTPNACTGCHLELKNVDASKHDDLPHYAAWMRLVRDGDPQVQAEVARVDQWAADHYQEWYGDKYGQRDHFAYTLARAWQGDATVVPELYDLARGRKHADIVRASALAQLGRLAPEQAVELSVKLLDDSDPQIRLAAVANLEFLPPRERLKPLKPLLRDPVRSVRIETARVLADNPLSAFDNEGAAMQKEALEDFRTGLRQHGDLAMSHMGLAILAERQSQPVEAVKAYQNAIRVQANVTGPRTNLAALLEQLASPGPGGAPPRLRDPKAANEIARLRAEELELLRRDARLVPEAAAVQYRLGLALYLAGELEEARAAMAQACELEPENVQFRVGLTLLLERLQDWRAATDSVAKLMAMAPGEQQYREIAARIQAGAANGGGNSASLRTGNGTPD